MEREGVISVYRAYAIASISLMTLVVPTAQAYIDELESSLENFSTYRPNYFLVGVPNVKTQVSVKVQPVEEVPVYFGYTQLLMWDVFKESNPVRDINYNPEVFYRHRLGDDNARRWLDLSPCEHESNGRAGAESRSWNRAYFRYSDIYWSLKLWVQYGDERGDTERYRGIGELTFTLSDFLGPSWRRGDLTLRIYPGGKSSVNLIKGGQELTLRIKMREPHVLPLMVLQVFQGFGEDLLDYDQRRAGVRLGIGF